MLLLPHEHSHKQRLQASHDLPVSPERIWSPCEMRRPLQRLYLGHRKLNCEENLVLTVLLWSPWPGPIGYEVCSYITRTPRIPLGQCWHRNLTTRGKTSMCIGGLREWTLEHDSVHKEWSISLPGLLQWGMELWCIAEPKAGETSWGWDDRRYG